MTRVSDGKEFSGDPAQSAESIKSSKMLPFGLLPTQFFPLSLLVLVAI